MAIKTMRCVGIATAALLFASPGFAEDRLYRIGIVTGQLPGSSAQSFLPFTQYLSERLPPAQFQVVQYASIEELLQAADRNSVEFAFSTPAAFVEMDLRHDVRPIATVTQSVAGKGAFPWLAGAVFVRNDRTELKALADARGQRIVALSPLALGGWLSALREWRRIGLDEKSSFQSVRFEFSYSKVVAEVCSGAADVGVIAAATLASLAHECPKELRVLPALDGPDARYPVPESTRLYPEAAFAVLGGVDDGFVSELTRELLSIESDSPAARAATVAGFSAPLSYTPVHELLKELHVRPYESYGRLTFTQAVEQHAGKVSVVLLVFVTLLGAALVRARRLNTRLEASIAGRNRAEEMRRRFEEHAQHAQRMDSIGRLAGAVAHDFNNLLTVINGYSELIVLDADGSPSEIRKNAEEISQAGKRAAELTQQLLTFSRKRAVHVAPIDLNEVIRECEKMFRVLLSADVEVTSLLAPDLWPVLGDRTQLHQVLINLVVNARDAMRGRGRLTLRTGNAVVAEESVQHTAGIVAGSYAWLEVSDSGAGMDRETLLHIFEPFFSTKGEAGTGLGLATVYGIVKQAGGGIGVTSEPGAGATFRVFLPRTESASAVNQASMPVHASVRVAAPPGQQCVMVVEDQDDVRGFANNALEARSYRVLEARTGEAALAIASSHKEPIHLLVADVVLGGMNGREVAERVLALHPETCVLFTSGYPDDEVARRGVSSGSVAFLAKPYSAAALIEKVAKMLTAAD